MVDDLTTHFLANFFLCFYVGFINLLERGQQ